MNQEISAYNSSLIKPYDEIAQKLAAQICESLSEAENKIWHGHPVWFLDGNPTVGYSMQKAGLRLMFWSGVDFNEPNLAPSKTAKYKDASIFYNSAGEVHVTDLRRWLEKSKIIQWDYKNIVKRKGVLERL